MKLSLLKLLLLTLAYFNIHYAKAEDELDEDEASKLDEDDDVQSEKKEEEEPIFNKLNVFRIRSEVELNYLTELLDFTILQFYYMPYSTNSKKVAEELIKVNKRLDNLAAIAAINCEEFEPPTFKHCQRNDYSADSFPKIRLFVPPEKRFNYETRELKKHFDIPYTEKDTSETSLFNFIAQNIPNRAVKLNSFNIVPFLNSDAMNKVILFTEKQYPGVMFRGLTANFFDKLLFGTIHSSESDLINEYNISSFPTLMVYKSQDKNTLLFEPEKHFFTGNIHNLEKLIEFLTPFALGEKRYTTINRGIPDETGEDLARTSEIMEIDKDNYIRFFEKYKEKKIMVLFHTKNKLKISVKKYLMEAHPFFINVFFNCKGEKAFCDETFGVKNFPTLRLFQENTFNSTLSKQQFTNQEAYMEFNTTSNSTFLGDLDRYVATKGGYQNVSQYNFRFALADAKERRKLMLIAFLNEKLQRVSR